MKLGRRLDILMAEDEDHDIFFVQHALQRLGTEYRLHAVHDGLEAIAFLEGQGQYADGKPFRMPNLVLTDLKMPRMGGLDFLRWLKNNPACLVMPVIVYSSSNHPDDVRAAYNLGANAYITKPNNLEQMTEILRVMDKFWSQCEFPPLPGKC